MVFLMFVIASMCWFLIFFYVTLDCLSCEHKSFFGDRASWAMEPRDLHISPSCWRGTLMLQDVRVLLGCLTEFQFLHQQHMVDRLHVMTYRMYCLMVVHFVKQVYGINSYRIIAGPRVLDHPLTTQMIPCDNMHNHISWHYSPMYYLQTIRIWERVNFTLPLLRNLEEIDPFSWAVLFSHPCTMSYVVLLKPTVTRLTS